jgi:hypothetical protein
MTGILKSLFSIFKQPKAHQPNEGGAMPVYLLLGQSNMVGMRSIADDLPKNLRRTQPYALFFSDGKWVELAPDVTEPKGFGPEISFSNAMAKKGETFGLIKVSAGATTLASEWSPARADGFYAKTMKMVAEARKSKNIRIAGVLWMQGESDGGTREMAEAYDHNLTNFIKTIRADLKSPSLPFVACRVTAPLEQFPFIQAVREAQAKQASANYAWFDSDHLTKGPDSLHYDTAGQIKLGELFAKSLKTIQPL